MVSRAASKRARGAEEERAVEDGGRDPPATGVTSRAAGGGGGATLSDLAAAAVSHGGAGGGGGGVDEDRAVREAFLELCRELNMDSATCEAAWSSYGAIGQNYTLEGNQQHWLACALYVACHDSSVPTVNRQGVVEGNGVSLTRLLRSCKLSLIQFFNKAKNWADMSNLKGDFRHKIDSLERNFAVSDVIFKKYQPIFVYLFKDPAKDPPRINRSRKQK